MSTPWPLIIGGLIVLIAASAVFRIVARLIWAFTLAAAVLLAFHFRENPGEAMTAYAALGAGHLVRRPLVRILGIL